MIKAFFTSIVLVIFFVLAYITDIFAILSLKTAFFLSLGLVIIMLIVAVFVIGIPKSEGREDDKTNN